MSEGARDGTVRVPGPDPPEPPPLWHTLPPELQECARILERTLAARDELRHAGEEARRLYQEQMAAAVTRYQARKLQPEEAAAFADHVSALVDTLQRAGLEAVGDPLFRWIRHQRAIAEYRAYLKDLHREERADRAASAAAGPIVPVNVAVLNDHLALLEHDFDELQEAVGDVGGYLLALEEDLKRARRLLRLLLHREGANIRAAEGRE